MTFDQLKTTLHNIVQTYFPGVPVLWQNSEKVKPPHTLVLMSVVPIGLSQHSIDIQSESDEPVECTQPTVRFTVDLFTHGEQVRVPEGGSYYSDTAISDIMDFVNYMKSNYVDSQCDKSNISIRTEGAPENLSFVQDPDFAYRARQQFIVTYTQESRGDAGIRRTDWVPTPSGGGTQELADQTTSNIEDVKIKENFIKEA